jgi:hypothetical protein
MKNLKDCCKKRKNKTKISVLIKPVSPIPAYVDLEPSTSVSDMVGFVT